MLSFRLLGSVEITHHGEPLRGFRSQKEPALLIYLAQTGQPQPRDFVAELLWESGIKQALSNLRTALARLQKQAGEALLVTHKSLALAPEIRQQVDSVKLLQALAGSGPITTAEAAGALQQALDTYRGDFLAHFHLRDAPRFDEWVALTREHIHLQVIAAYHKLGRYAQSAGDLERAIAVARRWLTVDALDEAAHLLLVRSLIEAGNTHAAAAHYDHCAELLRAELGVEPSAALAALIKDVRPKRAAAPRPISAARHNLPADHDQFFGRGAAQRELHMRLDQPWCRLLTIVGPGGVGKTRLATTVARGRLGSYQDGVWLVELEHVNPNDENLTEAIAVEIATVLDLRFTGSAKPAVQLLDYLQHRQLLLVLDNLEHLLEGVQIVHDIVRRCEQVQLVVTSREALRLRAEWAMPLSGLSYPSNDADATPAEAVELFAARRAQQQWQALSPGDQVAIRTICRMVEGLPLAIELAAALTREATPQTIAASLRDGFGALATSLRDLPQRHHSLQIVFEMSWRTLTPALQQRLARLSVFRSGCTAEAAQQIAGADAHQLAALVEKSLLAFNETSQRYTLHPVIHAYAAEKRLADDQTPREHARHYLAALAQHAELLQKDRPQDSLAALEPEIDNLRLAWQTGLAHQQAGWLSAALTPLSTYYQLRGLAREADAAMQETFEAAPAWNASGMALAARAGIERARFQNRLGQYWPAMQTVQATLKLAAACGDRWADGMAHVLWGESLWRLGKYEPARNKLGHALAVAQAIGSTLIGGWCHHHLGVIDDLQGRYDTAHAQLQQASAAWRQLDHANYLSISLNSVGLVCYHRGDLPAAQQAMQQALALAAQLDNRHAQALLLNNLGMIATELGDYHGAQPYLQRGLELAIASGNRTGQAEIYTSLGKNYRLLAETDVAVEHLEQGLRIAESLGNRSSMALAMLNLAQAKREQGDPQRAEALYRQALLIAEHDHLQMVKCELLLGLAELVSDTNPQQACQLGAEAVALAESLGNAQQLERANALAGRLHTAANLNQKNLSA